MQVVKNNIFKKIYLEKSKLDHRFGVHFVKALQWTVMWQMAGSNTTLIHSLNTSHRVHTDLSGQLSRWPS